MRRAEGEALLVTAHSRHLFSPPCLEWLVVEFPLRASFDIGEKKSIIEQGILHHSPAPALVWSCRKVQAGDMPYAPVNE